MSYSAGTFSGSRLDADNFKPAKEGLAMFDAFPKTKPVYLTRSRTGHHWTVLLVIMTFYLVSTEFYRWLSGTVTHNFAIEKGIGHEMQLNLDIVVAMQCEDLRVNIRDVAGDHVSAGMVLKKDPTMWSQWGPRADKQVHVLESWPAQSETKVKDQNKGKKNGKINEDQDVLGSAAAPLADALRYGLGLKEDVHDYLSLARSVSSFPKTPKLKKKEAADACRIYGSFELNKVRGNLHITPRGYAYVEFGPGVPVTALNLSHQINELSFGPFYPNLVNPLDKSIATTDRHNYRYQYFLSLVPTIYTTDAGRLDRVLEAAALGAASGTDDDHYGQLLQEKHRSHKLRNPIKGASRAHTVFTNQYAVTKQAKEISLMGIPGLYFTYDFEPIMLLVVEKKSSFLVMLIRLVNVMSGVMVGLGWCAQLTDWLGGLWFGGDGKSRRPGGILTGKALLGIGGWGSPGEEKRV